jgi:hypothetical protein
MSDLVHLLIAGGVVFLWLMAVLATFSNRSNALMVRHANRVNRSRNGRLPIQEEEN